MPTYDYQCRSCGAITEVIHSMLEPGPTTCERCGGDLRRILYPAGIIFKGSGFYRTDSRNASSGSTGSASVGSKSGEGAGGDAGAVDGGGTSKSPATDGSGAASSASPASPSAPEGGSS